MLDDERPRQPATKRHRQELEQRHVHDLCPDEGHGAPAEKGPRQAIAPGQTRSERERQDYHEERVQRAHGRLHGCTGFCGPGRSGAM